VSQTRRIVSVYPATAAFPPSDDSPKVVQNVARVGDQFVVYEDVVGAPAPDEAELQAWSVATYVPPANLPPLLAARRASALQKAGVLVNSVNDASTQAALISILNLIGS
jgi:hypothetical protein